MAVRIAPQGRTAANTSAMIAAIARRIRSIGDAELVIDAAPSLFLREQSRGCLGPHPCPWAVAARSSGAGFSRAAMAGLTLGRLVRRSCDRSVDLLVKRACRLFNGEVA
jgi:hypothetical protein